MLNEAADEIEYQKLLSAWDLLSASNKPDSFMQLFLSYLDQIWIDSQNMLQCAQYWQTIPTETAEFSDAAHTMNSLGLHLMRKSLQTRQELSALSFNAEFDDKDTFYSASSYSKHEKMMETLCKSPSESIKAMNLELPLNRSRSFIRLMRSPSAPNQRRSELYYSFQDVLPECQYNKYPLENVNERCKVCKGHSPFKKSYSFENFQTTDDVRSDSSSDVYLNEKEYIEKKPVATQRQSSPLAEKYSAYSDEKFVNLNPVDKTDTFTSDSKTCTVSALEEDVYTIDSSFTENTFNGTTEAKIQRSPVSAYRVISNSIFQPLLNIKLSFKKRSSKVDASDKPKSRARRFVSKFQIKR
ncbi:hypothetical protein BY458DRAFT_558205 [Sporodiniella umbellata]|nr:hypothetical protein BY458DRAFT_558205 [Sporodiniella umbellata]